MAHSTDTINVVPTPEKDALKFDNLSKTHQRKTFEQLEGILMNGVASEVQSGKERSAREGFSSITGRINLELFRSDEIKDCVQIVQTQVCWLFDDSHEVTFIYHDTNDPSKSGFYGAGAHRDVTFIAVPL